jgi:hypothetical protein
MKGDKENGNKTRNTTTPNGNNKKGNKQERQGYR